MKTVKDLAKLHARTVTDRAEIDKLRWFQVTRYFECGLLQELPTHIDDDPYVDESTYFGVYNEREELLATARIVKTDREPEILRHHRLYPADEARLRAERHSVTEVSRLAVGRNAPHFAALVVLTREFLHHGLRDNGGQLQLASIGKPLVRILNRMIGVPIDVIGPEIDRYGDFIEDTIPVLIDSAKCLEAVRTHTTPYWWFFEDGLVIDLTEPIDPTEPIDLRDPCSEQVVAFAS